MMNILIVDDDKEIVDLIEIYLKYEQFKILKAWNGEEALAVLADETVHLVVLDIMMPKVDGLTVLKTIRQTMNIPIILLSAKSEDMDKVNGLMTGADDYLTKPFNPIELVARIKAQLRRYTILKGEENNQPQVIEASGVSIDLDKHNVEVDGQSVNLTPTEYAILALMVEKPGKVFSGEALFEAVWKEKSYDSNNTVMVHMWRLREKIEKNPKEPRIIKTVWGVGYKIDS